MSMPRVIETSFRGQPVKMNLHMMVYEGIGVYRFNLMNEGFEVRLSSEDVYMPRDSFKREFENFMLPKLVSIN